MDRVHLPSENPGFSNGSRTVRSVLERRQGECRSATSSPREPRPDKPAPVSERRHDQSASSALSLIRYVGGAHASHVEQAAIAGTRR